MTREPAATVVSLVPFPVNEEKPGMFPARFFIDPAPEGGFSTLLVTKCQHGVYLDEFRPTLIVPSAPEEVAQAICFDYMKGQTSITVGEAEPGLFWVPGDFCTPEGIDRKAKDAQLKAQYSAMFTEANRKQINWFKALVAQADDAWQHFKRRSMISMMQKIAAARLKIDREWMLDIEVEKALSECPVCFEKVHPLAIICRGCNAVLRPDELSKIQFAGQVGGAGKK